MGAVTYLCAVGGVDRSRDLFASLVITFERQDASRDSRAYRENEQGHLSDEGEWSIRRSSERDNGSCEW